MLANVKDDVLNNYNSCVTLVEYCVEEILDYMNMYLDDNIDFDDDDLWHDLCQCISYFSLEVLSKFSH